MWSRKLILTLCAALCCGAAQASPDDDAYRSAEALSRSGSRTEAAAAAKSLLKKYPSSDHVADARLLIADNEPDPDKALQRYATITDKYRYFKKRDEASLTLCRILYLCSRYAECAEEAKKGYDSFNDSALRGEFLLLKARSEHAMQQFDKAEATLKQGGTSDAAGLLLADIAARTDDDGAADWQPLSKGDYPETALYSLAKEYESQGLKNEAFSAYSDLTSRYPRSMEALYAAKPKARLAKAGAKYKTAEAHKRQRLSKMVPERTESDEDSGEEFSIVIGPFYNLRQAGKIKKEMTSEFLRAVIVKREREFVIYVGRVRDRDDAVSMKIRLAEEFGFNGTLVNIRQEENREYFYGQ